MLVSAASTQDGRSHPALRARYDGVVDTRSLGLIVVLVGLGVALIGVLIAVGALSWFGRLPGDIRYESDNVKVYVPLVSMLLSSVVVSVVLMLLSRLR